MNFGTAIRILLAGGRDNYTAKVHFENIKTEAKIQGKAFGLLVSGYVQSPDNDARIKELVLKRALKEPFFKARVQHYEPMIKIIAKTKKEINALEKKSVKLVEAYCKAARAAKEHNKVGKEIQDRLPGKRFDSVTESRFKASHKPLQEAVDDIKDDQDITKNALTTKKNQLELDITNVKQGIAAHEHHAGWMDFWLTNQLKHKKVIV